MLEVIYEYMLHQSADKFPRIGVTNFGSTNTTMQWFRQPAESTHFMLRKFEIQAQGHIGLHSHPEEHQIYILKGPILLVDSENHETEVQTDEFVYCPPHEVHGYRNPNSFTVSFLCGIPKLNS